MIAIGEWLTRPGARVAAGERRRARLVASILAALIVVGTLSASLQLALVPGFLPTFVIIMVAIAILVATWSLNRAGYCGAATLATSAIPTIASFGVVLANPADAGSLAFALLGVIAASLLVSTRAGAAMGLAAVAGVPVIAMVRPEVSGSLLAAMGSFLAIGSILVVVTARHRDREEDDRRRDAERMMLHLQRTDRLAALGTLAASIAHEVNNPLMCVSANLELLARDLGADPRRRSMVQDAQLGADQIAAIARTLLGFARGDRDGREPVHVERSLEVAIRMAEPQIRGRARLARQFAEVPPIIGGRHRLEQVFLNLLLNAAQAIPDDDRGDHEIAVRLGPDGEGSVLVEITDTGVGIPAEALDRIFEPFFSTKAEGRGTGLGLSVCKDIVTAFGGRITVDSVVGRGTTIRVALPEARPMQ